MIQLSIGDRVAEAILAEPDAAGPHPGVLLFGDAIGLRPQIASMARRIAGWGYAVLAPHLFHRLGSVEELRPTADLREPDEFAAFIRVAMGRVQTLTPERLQSDVAAYLGALRASPSVAPGPVGVVGYCMGARIAVRAAGWFPADVAACGGFHGGGLATDADDSPHRGLRDARARFVFGHADHDRSMNRAAVARLGRALAEAGLDASNAIYPGAPHGYTMADTSAYDEASAERHYSELRALFDGALAGTRAG